jgi:hypothetical protein
VRTNNSHTAKPIKKKKTPNKNIKASEPKVKKEKKKIDI